MECDRSASLAFTRVPATEVEGDFQRRPDICPHQNLQEKFEALRLERKSVDCFSAHDEITRHGIFDPQAIALQGKRRPSARL